MPEAGVVRRPRGRAPDPDRVAQTRQQILRAAMHRRLVIEPALGAVRRKVEQAVARGDAHLAPLLRFPQLVAGPVVLGTVWNGLWGREQPVDMAAMFEAFLELAFGAG